MYKRSNEARSRNHCSRRKAINITYSECMSVALVTAGDKGHPGHRQAASSVLYTTSCKHSLVLLRMCEIVTRKHVELIIIINKICYCCI